MRAVATEESSTSTADTMEADRLSASVTASSNEIFTGSRPIDSRSGRAMTGASLSGKTGMAINQ